MYSSSLLIVSSSPLLLIMHRLGEYPFGFDDVLIGFDLTFVMSVSKSSDFRIINIAAFRLVLSVLISDKRLRLRASLVIDDVCLYRFAGTSLTIGLIMRPPIFSISRPLNAFMLDPLLAELNKSLFTGCWFVSAVATADAIISVSCAGVVGMFTVGSVTVLAITLNVVGAVEEEEDTAPELFLPLRVAIRRDSSLASNM